MSKNVLPKAYTQASAASPTDKNNSNNRKKKCNKKRKLPITFLDAPSLDMVVGPPPERRLYTTPVASEVVKEIFLDRLVKEIVMPFLCRPKRARESTSTVEYQHIMKDGKLVKQAVSNSAPNGKEIVADIKTAPDKASNQIWKERILMGTNQCSRLLERLSNHNEAGTNSPTKTMSASLIVLARDVYPPTMLAHIPQLAQGLQIPVLLLPGQASLELGNALTVQRTSILIFMASCFDQKDGINKNEDDDHEMDPIDSFVAFVKDQIPKK
jgi:ribosomal protein L7Ae-like RNA K-turn-binding protein